MLDNRRHGISLFSFMLIVYFSLGYGCDIAGINSPISEVTILDTFSGNIYDNQTSGITNIENVVHNNILNAGPYFDVSLNNDLHLIIKTNEAFKDYERNEVLYNDIPIVVNFRCSGGTIRQVNFFITIRDTNNHEPEFLLSKDVVYTVPTPLPPGYAITGCYSGITVEDIDLTTMAINFTIEKNPYFEVVYDEDLSTTPKEFIGTLRTTSFLRNLPNSLTLEVTATDYDRTGDPTKSTTTTITIKSDTEYLPEDPIFAQAFYFATYTNSHQVILDENISLQSGFNEDLSLELEGEYANHFKLMPSLQYFTIETLIKLEPEVLRKKQIFLVVRAIKENTSGDTATVIVQLPKDEILLFKRTHYEGTIKDNTLQVPQLTLSQGYEGDDVDVRILGEHADYFIPDIQENVITLSVNKLSDSVINDNNVISITVEAFTEFSSAVTVVTLEIIKDDNVTPVFNKPIYTGSYATETSLNLENIILNQGYGDGVEFSLDGDHKEFFVIKDEGHFVTLSVNTSIPSDIFSEQHILLTLHATKSRTVGASTAIVITLPEGKDVTFEKIIYKGVIQFNDVRHETITISNFEGDKVGIHGEFSSFFVARAVDRKVIVEATGSFTLPNDVTRVILELHAEDARAALILDVDQSDSETGKDVIFEKLIYEGHIQHNDVRHETITIFNYGDDDIKIRGEYSSSFQARAVDGKVTVVMSGSLTLPNDVTRVVLELHAANAKAVLILEVQQSDSETGNDITFDKLIYDGHIQLNDVRHDTILISNYEGDNIGIRGEFSSLFVSRVADGKVTIAASGTLTLPNDVTHVVLELHAADARAVLVLDVDQSDLQTGVTFGRHVYEGHIKMGDVRHEPITIFNYHGDNVWVRGEFSRLFEARAIQGEVTVLATGSLTLPDDVTRIILELHAVDATTVLILDVDQSDSETGNDITFDKLIYDGHIQLNDVRHDTILISNYEGDNIGIRGEFSSLFVARVADGKVTIAASGTLTLPNDVTHVVLELHAADARAVLVLDVDQSDLQTGVTFGRHVYEGHIKMGDVRHEPITIFNYHGDNVWVRGEFSRLFEARAIQGEVTVLATGSLTLPDDVTRIILELHAVDATTVLILDVDQSDSETGNDITFDKLIYDGHIQLNDVRHDTILISNYEGDNIGIRGEFSSLFVARVADGKVTIAASGTLTLPNDVTHVVLELHAADARAVLVLDVDQSDLQTGVTFGRHVYEGHIKMGDVRHEPITIFNYHGDNVWVRGEFSRLFEARAIQGEVTVLATGSLTLPDDVTRIILELHAVDATTVLILDVDQSDSETGNDITFDKLIYDGHIQLNDVRHDTILISNYEGDNIGIRGEFSSLFVARVADGKVTIAASGTLTLPNDVTHVVLELHAADARAVLVLDVDQSDLQTGVTFGRHVYEGHIKMGDVRHEPITIFNYHGDNVWVRGEFSSLFEARAIQGEVTVLATGSLTLPDDVTRIILELHAVDATTVLILDVDQSDSETSNDTTFDKLIYDGHIQLNDVRHDTILISYDEGDNVGIRGEFSSLFVARVADGKVTVAASGTLTLPNDVTHVVLELHAADARAVLVLDVDQSDLQTGVTFGRHVYEGHIKMGDVRHEPITISNYHGDNVWVRGEFSSLFEARAIQGEVTVLATGSLTLPDDVTRIILELHAVDATTVLILDVDQSDSETGNDTTFDKLIYDGHIQLNDVRHDTILISNYKGHNVGIRGEFSSLFVARVADGKVTVAASGTLTLPNDVTHVVLELHAADARAVLVLDVDQSDLQTGVTFGRHVYEGHIKMGDVRHEPITISNYHGDNVWVRGEYSSLFEARAIQGEVTVLATGSLTLPDDVTRIILELHAVDATTVLILDVDQSDSETGNDTTFDKLIYDGHIQLNDVRHDTILISNYEGDNVGIRGEFSSLFVARVADGKVTVAASGTLTLPNDVTHVVLELHAADARAVLVLDVDQSDLQTGVTFGRHVYEGHIKMGDVRHEPITISNYHGDNVWVRGEFSSLFEARAIQGEVTVLATGSLTLPDDVTRFILELHAVDATTVLILDVDQSDSETGNDTTFDKLIYDGHIQLNDVRHDTILISNYKGHNVGIRGEFSSLFVARVADGKVTVAASGTLTLPNDVTHVVLELHAADARAVLVLDVDQSDLQTGVTFGRHVYEGHIKMGDVRHEPITISNYHGDNVWVRGEYSSLFEARAIQGEVTVLATGSLTLPDDVTRIILELHAVDATTVLILDVDQSDSETGNDTTFDKLIYDGHIQLNDVRHDTILISNYEGDNVGIRGEFSSLFVARVADGKVTVAASGTLTLPNDVTHVVLELHAADARAVLVLDVDQSDFEPGDHVLFNKLVYDGFVHGDSTLHENIIISNYNGNVVGLHGEYSSLFVARVVGGVVTVTTSGPLALPIEVKRVVLELHAADARAVLLLDVLHTDAPIPPVVTFGSPSYAANVDVTQTGRVTQVEATADNGEALLYSLTVEDDHLQARVSINRDGELFLSAPANSGVYTFQVIATTLITRAQGTATVYLRVQAITIIDDNKIVVPPLIILNRDEEEPHNDLVLLNSREFEGCHFDITNRWPINQPWLFVDENGLHATAINREDESIAFMALSQVQVELILHCESDTQTRTKRSTRTDWLGPYDYGTNQWILTESIPYDSRRSLVNLIINDINDNPPIFNGNEFQPLAVGYPNTEIAEVILPRSLAELQATDADIGENAALMYWSSEDTLAVSPITGFVHVRSGATLQNNQRLIVSATDRNGQGLTGTIELLVKLLNLNNIAVVTVTNAFLENELSILAQISEAVGYEVKALKSVIVSDNENLTRKLRDTSTSGASLQLYVYGLLQREPILVESLIEDINNNAAISNAISTISLEDHLVPITMGDRDNGFLIATIVLSSLLFILTVLIGIWFLIKWRKNKNYNEVSDTKSLVSSSSRESIIEIKNHEATKPRTINIEELKRSEKRLQDRLNTPTEAVNIEPSKVKKQIPTESIVDLLSPESNTPIVIQSIDKLKDSDEPDVDDFGEKAGKRRKSVVTFNENVEKIIHVENDTDSISTTSDFEIYKF